MTDIYIVKAGDTLWSISKKYNITVDKLVKLNGLYGNTKDDLKIGQKIKLKEDDCYWSTKTTIGCANTFPPIIPVSVRAFTKSFTAFVGGAADKYQFLNRPFGIDPPDDIGLGPTEIMKNCMEKFKKKIGTKVNNASFGYYGYEEAYSNKSKRTKVNDKFLLNLLTDIKKIVEKEPATQINLVGHSLGGWNVAGLSEELHKQKICRVQTLITLDPVGILLSKGFSRYLGRAQIYFSEPDPIAQLWVHIHSKPDESYRDDYVAKLGGRWNNNETKKANYRETTKYHHGEAYEMFTKVKFDNNSAEDLLINELRKVIK
nr:LysM peptidoglycan-binding domain-containing protein [Acinetobacter sp. Marseille-Q1620]